MTITKVVTIQPNPITPPAHRVPPHVAIAPMSIAPKGIKPLSIKAILKILPRSRSGTCICKRNTAQCSVGLTR